MAEMSAVVVFASGRIEEIRVEESDVPLEMSLVREGVERKFTADVVYAGDTRLLVYLEKTRATLVATLT